MEKFLPTDRKFRTDSNVEDNSVIGQSSQYMDPDSGVRRGLKTRHLSMMALAGIIGPGLLVGAGGALSSGGPAALLIGFLVIGVLAFSVLQSVGELTTLYPAKGGFTSLGDRFVDRGFGAAVGINYFVIWIAVLANEYNTSMSILYFWTDRVPLWAWFILLWFFFLAFQLLGVEAFGEAEFWLALIKIVGLTTFFLFSLIYCAGGVKNRPAFGFHYWNDPGAFSHGFKGVASVFVFCATFYAGSESVAVAATEARDPGVAVPRAINQVFWRIIFVYIGSALFYGITVPWNSPGLISSTSKALKSPMTIAIQNAGWTGGVHLINAFILITCLSAINSSIYISSRTVLYMSQGGKLPKFLGWTDKRGVPVYAVLVSNLFGCLALMNLGTSAGQAYSYIVNLSGVSTFLVWGSISLIHLRFRKAWSKQGYSKDQLPFKSLLYPYSPIFGLAANIFLALIQGWTVFSPFSAGDFVDAYILIPLFFIIWFAYKYFLKSSILPLDQIDLDEDRRQDITPAIPSKSWFTTIRHGFK